MRRFFYAALFLVALLGSCDDGDTPASKSDFEYLPLVTGQYQVYDVDSVWYTNTGLQYEKTYQLMTEVVDSFANGQGSYTFVIYLSTRATASDEWNYVDTWSAHIDVNRVVVTEGSTSYVKFVTPTSVGRTWDGNLYNNLGEDSYEIVGARTPMTVGDQTYDDTIEIEQQKDEDIIVKTDIRREVYSRDVGLILRESTILEYCTVGCVTFGDIESGAIYSQTLVDHGRK